MLIQEAENRLSLEASYGVSAAIRTELRRLRKIEQAYNGLRGAVTDLLSDCIYVERHDKKMRGFHSSANIALYIAVDQAAGLKIIERDKDEDCGI